MPKVDNDVVIVGIGETKSGNNPGMESIQIQAEAVTRALIHAGLTIRDVDGLINQDPYSSGNSMYSLYLTEYLGASVKWASTMDVGGMCSSIGMLQSAIWAIKSGHCEVVAVTFGENLRSSRPASSHGFVNNTSGPDPWEEPFGLQSPVIAYALVMRRYIHQTGARPEDFGEVAVVTRRHAQLNDNAMMKGRPMSMDDYLASRIISDPIKLFDCSIPSDGGGALILTTRERAKRMNSRPVGIRSIALRATHSGVVNMPNVEDIQIKATGDEAFEAAGMGPEDMHVATIHDAFTLSVLMTLEALGFAKPGEGGNYMRSGAASLGGRCPVNPHGGLLSQGHAGGIYHPVEAVRQLRGEAKQRQVEGAKRAIVSGNGGIFGICGTMILERDW